MQALDGSSSQVTIAGLLDSLAALLHMTFNEMLTPVKEAFHNVKAELEDLANHVEEDERILQSNKSTQ